MKHLGICLFLYLLKTEGLNDNLYKLYMYGTGGWTLKMLAEETPIKGNELEVSFPRYKTYKLFWNGLYTNIFIFQ